MSVITLQVGQCGNQIGFEFFQLLSQYLSKSTNTDTSSFIPDIKEKFFNVTEKDEIFARAVMVDMEQKVIGQILHETRKSPWQYKKGQQVTGKRGSGNNWAQGYYSHGPQSLEDVLEKISRETEKCDSLSGFLTTMSLAGGTGSGLGTFITTAIKDEYPHCNIINEVIWPYTSGEVNVQNYNSVLTLSHLYSSSDGIIIMENEKMQAICTKLLKIKDVSFKDINKVVAVKLAGVLLPAENQTKYTLSDILQDVCSHPGYKLLNILSIPMIAESSLVYTSYNWNMLVKHCRQMLIANANMEEGINWEVKVQGSSKELLFNKSLSNLLFLRGKDSNQVDISSFKEPLLYTHCIPEFGRCHAAYSNTSLNNVDNSITLLSNSQALLAPLNNMVNKAWETFSSKAYIHQYSEYGIDQDDFVDSFVSLEQVIKNYAYL